MTTHKKLDLELSKITNACEIGNYIESLTGLSSDSNSPTDTWILKTLPGTKYKDFKIENLFLKLSINADSYLENLANVNVARQQNPLSDEMSSE